MTTEEWIRSHFHISALDDEILIQHDYYVVGIYIDKFIGFFGAAIQKALDNNFDVIQAIKESDPNNELGYNDII